jgi:hypothetical protein
MAALPGAGMLDMPSPQIDLHSMRGGSGSNPGFQPSGSMRQMQMQGGLQQQRSSDNGAMLMRILGQNASSNRGGGMFRGGEVLEACPV